MSELIADLAVTQDGASGLTVAGRVLSWSALLVRHSHTVSSAASGKSRPPHPGGGHNFVRKMGSPAAGEAAPVRRC